MAFQSPVEEELPRELYVEVTNRCNSLCETCIRTYDLWEPLRDLTLIEVQGIVDQMPTLQRVVLHGIGEPLLNVELAEMIRYVKDRLPSAIVLFNSNAILLDEDWQQALIDAGLDELRVSLDAATAATYARIRGIDAFARVIENLRHFARLLRQVEHPRLSLWLTTTRENIGELPALIDLAAEIGVPEVYVQRLVLFGQGLARVEQSVCQLELQAQEEAALADATERATAHGVIFRASGLVSPQESLRGRTAADRPWSSCVRPWTTTYITANGNVLPCCISPFSTTDYASLILGNVFQAPFAQIWNGPKYVARRAALPTAQPLHPCERCGVSWSL